MADRVPLIVNNITSQIEELQVSDDLTLLGSNLLGVYDAEITNTLNANSINANNVVADIFNTPSDLNLKENIVKLDNCLKKVSELRGVSFDWKNGKGSACGVIAQEVEKVFPEAVTTIHGTKHVNYDGLIGVLIEAVKELQFEVETLKKSINT